ncbi:hypothetical protein [Nocardioides antri]|uniref:Uncharacterized protein n=1 Tax=Nocardioides antri TaxID=2607659 RepID=A0A5B1M683_9ACTN|nr:hypothetical protein [Nocardioides antri]KAA1427180.1 hypothetical protein F0U47_06635 [Nocardioides antri]
MKDLRRVVVTLVIGSFTLAALMGIAVLLGAGGFGETQWRVLATTVAVGVTSVALLCHLGLAGRSHAWVGLLGAAVALVAFGSSLELIWGTADTFTLWSASGTIAATLAQVSLLLTVAARRDLDWLLVPTLAAAVLVAAMIVGPILNESAPDGDGYFRLLGVLAILDVLGTLVLIALAVFGRRPARVAATASGAGQVTLDVDAAVRDRVLAVAAARGTTPSEVVEEALASYPRR